MGGEGGLAGFVRAPGTAKTLEANFHPLGAFKTGFSWFGRPSRKEARGVESRDLAAPPENPHAPRRQSDFRRASPSEFPGSTAVRTHAPRRALQPEKTWQPPMTSCTARPPARPPAVAMMKTRENGA